MDEQRNGNENENENENENGGGNGNNTVATYVGVALAVAGVVVQLVSLFSGSGNDVGKMMKAPGQAGVKIPRNVFESNPSSYFRNLRKN